MMKKSLLLFAFCCFSWSLWAGDGSSKKSPIEFDWEHGNVQDATTKPVWFRVGLDSLYTEEDPALALYIINETDSVIHVKADAFLSNQEENREYDIEPYRNKIWSVPVAVLVRMRATECFLAMTTNGKIRISADVQDVRDIDKACINAQGLDWGAPISQSAGSKWYMVSLRDAQAADGKVAKLTLTNMTASPATVKFLDSPDCPSTGTTEHLFKLAGNETVTISVPRTALDMLDQTETYLQVTTSAAIRFTVNLEAAATPKETASSCQNLELDKEFDIVGGKWYRIPLSLIRKHKYMPEIKVTNENGSPVTFDEKIMYTSPGEVFLRKDITVAAYSNNIATIQPNLIEALSKAGYEYMYISASNSSPLKGYIRMRHIHEGEGCSTPRSLKYGVAERLNAASLVWYALPVTELKSTTPYSNLKWIVNSAENADLTLHVATACPSYDTQDYSYSVTGGVEFSKLFPSSFFRMLITDTLYIGMEATKTLTFTTTVVSAPALAPASADVCAAAVDFDWTYGHQLTAGANQWYNIDLSPLHLNGATAELLPVLSIKNRGSVAATVQMKMSRDCPLKSEPVIREISIPAGETYESAISMDMLTDINPSLTKLWAYISSSQDIDWRIRFVRENEGSSCAVPYLFNWVSGNDINNATAWYMLDLTEAKASDKDIILSIDNLDAAASLTLGLAPTCPCDAPQEQSTSFKAHQHRESRVVHSSFAAMPDTVWVRASTVGRFHVEAKLVDPEPFTPITIVNPTPINWGETIAQSAGDSVWYYILPDTLNKVSDLTARLKIENGTSSNVVYTHQAYEREITSQLAEWHFNLASSAVSYRVFERSMADLMTDKDTIFVCFVAAKAFSFTVELVDPNTGNNCEHAITLNPVQRVELPAGADVWYRVDVANIADTLSCRLELTLKNYDHTKGKVKVSLHTGCDSLAFQSTSYTLGANATLRKEFDSDFIRGLNMDVLYAHITSDALDSLFTALLPEVPLDDTIFVCDSAIACVPNTDYYQHAGDTVWYVIDIRNIRENTVGDAVLTITNSSSTTNHLVGELAWNCPVVKQMTYKSYDVKTKYVRVLERSELNSYKQTQAYLRLTATKDFSFRVDAQLAKGDMCTNPILFDWEHGNIHPKDSIFWYRVEMDSALFENRTLYPDSVVYQDMRLLVENLADDSTSAGADIFFDCDDPSLGSFGYTFAPSGYKYKDIDRDLLSALGWPDMYLSYHSGNTTRISASFISEAEKVYYYDTIQATVCDSSEFQYRINEDKLIVHEIYSGDPASQWWTDTVSFVDGTSWNDSVYVFHVRPVVMMPVLNTPQALDTLAHALPILKQGMVPFFDSSLEALKEYYQSVMSDTLSRIADEDIYWYNEYYTPIPKTMSTFKAYYAFRDSCDNYYNFDIDHDFVEDADRITFMVEPWRYDTLLVSTNTVCPGETVTTIHGNNYVVNSEVYIRDTVFDVLVTDTLDLPRKIDSVYVYHYYTWVYPDLETELPVQPVVACGKSIDCTKATQYLKSIYMPDEKFDPLDVTITDVIWQRYNLTTDEFEDLPVPALENRLDSATQWVVLRYGLVTECLDTIFSDTIRFAPDSYVRVYETVTDTVCAGTEYAGTKTHHIVESPFVTWNDTVIVNTDSLTFDSVYIYTKYAYAMPEPVATLPSQPLVACGKVIDCSAATAALRQTYMPEVKTNPLDVTVTDVIWQRKDVGAGTYAALDSTRVDRAVTSVVLRYGLVTECGTVYSVDFEFTPTAYVVVEQVVKDMVCAGTEYQGAQKHTISAYTEWNDTVLVETDTLTFDSVYIYQISVYEALVLPVYTTPLAAHAGMPVNVTAQTSELEADFAQKNKQSLDDITWEILLPSASWTALTTDTLAAALAGQTVQLRYTVKALCETKTSDAIDVDVHGYYRVDTTIIDAVCLGTAYEGRLTTHTITALTEWTDSVRTEALIASDYVFHYSVVPYLFALPEDLNLAGIIAICDTAVSVEAPQAQIDELMADPLFAPNTVVTWQMFRGSQWDTLTADPIYDDEVRIRVNITSDCGTLTSDEITLTVVKPTADNQTRYNSLPVEAMFGNRIIMINYRATREVLGLDSISPDSVRWYRVVGELDNLDLPAGTGDDEFVGIGYYYTTGEPLVGSFYARLMYHESDSLPCGVVARTKVVDCVLTSSAPKLSPTIVQPRQTMTLSGIMPKAEVTVTVFSQLGELIERYSGTGTSITELQAAASEGCYLVYVTYDDETVTFKYIVK